MKRVGVLYAKMSGIARATAFVSYFEAEAVFSL